MKKLISAIVAMATVLSAFCIGSTALEAGYVGLELVSAEGTKVVVDLVIHDTADFVPKSFGVYLKYPSNAAVESCEFLRTDGNGTTGIAVPGIPYQITWTADADSLGKDKLAVARLTFKAGADVNETPLELSLALDSENPVADKNGNDVTGGFKFNGLTVGGRIPGDADGDGKVKLADVSVMLKYIAKWDVEMDSSNADVTGDGKVSMTDVSLLLQYIAGWDVVLK